MIASGSRTLWQTTLADLALILFMITAASIEDRPPVDRDTMPAQGQPLAIYRADAEGPSLGQWLDAQPRDARQHLTIIARYRPGAAAEAATAAMALERAAANAGQTARIVIEPAQADDLMVVLDFDGRELAQGAPTASGTQVAFQ